MKPPALLSGLARVALGVLCLAALVQVAAHLPRLVELQAELPGGFKAIALGVLVTVLTAIAGSLLSLILVFRSWDRSGASTLALFLALLSLVWGSLLRFLELEVEESGLSLDVLIVAAAWAFAVAAFVRLSASFPAPLAWEDASAGSGPGRRLRRRLSGPFLPWLLALVLIGLFRAGNILRFLGIDPAAIPLGRDARLTFLLSLGVGVLVVPLLGIALGMANLIQGYRQAGAEDRGRILWLVAGSVVAGWMLLGSIASFTLIFTLDLEVPDPLFLVQVFLLVLAPTVLVAAVAVALFRSGAVDPGLVIRRGTVYGALGAMGLLLFAGLENAVSGWVEQRLGLPGVLGSILAGSGAAALMLPFRRPLARWASRWLPTEGERS